LAYLTRRTLKKTFSDLRLTEVQRKKVAKTVNTWHFSEFSHLSVLPFICNRLQNMFTDKAKEAESEPD
jgi:hypothetical protein